MLISDHIDRSGGDRNKNKGSCQRKLWFICVCI